jgi:hypothetical protein
MKIARLAVVAALAASLAGCRQKAPPEPPLAKPSVTLSRDHAALGSPIDVTYRFDIETNAPPITENYKVFVGVLDADQQLMWTDDHDPPTPTTQWKPGQKIEYTRTVFIPIYPYIGDSTIRMGLYSPASKKRVTLSGTDKGQKAYQVATLQLLPQSENVFVVRKDGWHGPETPPNDAHIEWQWTKTNEATLAFKNPRKDALFYFEVDNPSQTFPQGQHVQVKLDQSVVDDFMLEPQRSIFHKIPLAAAQFGSGDMVELKILADKTFVPALVPGSTNKDPRELGVRVFHAFIEPKK